MANYWISALKEFNRGKSVWTVPKKGSKDYETVRGIFNRMKKKS